MDKPAGWTSHDVVGRIRRLTGERRVGHAGTLDPAATGVLPVAVGSATRVLEFVSDAAKSYVAEITFGVETDTFDADGQVTGVKDPSALDLTEVARVLQAFLGSQRQVPPMYSAVRVGGRRLYEEARQGKTVDRPARPVVFHQLDVLAWDPPTVTVYVECSKGTYVRSLAQDLGVALGVGAHLSALVRMKAGVFTLCQAWTLQELAGLDLASVWAEVALHPDVVLDEWPALILNDAGANDWSRGNAVAALRMEERCRVYDEEGEWLGVGAGHPETQAWRPTKVTAVAP
ncbi:MAG: tRNA pseudouridine(55) synthase TruB [Chloroflexota bacterium]|nr:tRNA pseudouridine(55) synthase TruB [Chloroflexota bacterium]